VTRAGAVVVGSGLAGLMTAIELRGMPVILLTRGTLGDGGSSGWAQGGVAVALGEDDSPDLHARDTVAAGAGLTDALLAGDLAREAPAALERMVAIGADLDRLPDGTFAMGREAAHSRRRIVHAHGDATGRELMRAATEAVRRAPWIRVIENAALTDVLVSGGRATGVRYADRIGRLHTISARRVVLATGGLGALYRYTTNPPGQWGSGLAVAARAGATLTDLEFVQFHPTALASGADPLPLVSEAVRGEGATLVDGTGRSIMADIDARGDLAPRDVVARAVSRTLRTGGQAFLDARTRPGAAFPQRFENIFAACTAAGIDPRFDLLPVVPAAHYHMGGIAVDAHGRTSLPGLWACGEVSATGVHGANRLASNSLLEALVFARRVAQDASGTNITSRSIGSAPARTLPYELPEDDAVARGIRERMFSDVGIERDANGLSDAFEYLQRVLAEARSQRIRDMATVGAFVTRAALERRESRGSQFRTDFPEVGSHAERSFWNLEPARGEPIPA
jgi:L-aspartate oxidase